MWAREKKDKFGIRGGPKESLGKVPPAKPRLNEVLRRIACIGGFLARKGDGEPRVKTIWLGLKNVHVAVKTMRAMRRLGSQQTCV